MGLKSRRRKLTETSVRQRHSSSKDKNVFSQYGCNILQPHGGWGGGGFSVDKVCFTATTSRTEQLLAWDLSGMPYRFYSKVTILSDSALF